jgi:hypothetical protein
MVSREGILIKAVIAKSKDERYYFYSCTGVTYYWQGYHWKISGSLLAPAEWESATYFKKSKMLGEVSA